VTFHLEFTTKARLEFTEAALWWAEKRSAEQAARWYDRFEAAIESIADNPLGYGRAREDDLYEFESTLYQLLFGLGRRPTHCALFQVREDRIYIVAIRHVAQQDVTPSDV